MSYREGIERLETIKRYLKENGPADIDTLTLLFFPSKHRAQVVLANWVHHKELQRKRYDQFIYFLPKYTGDIRAARDRNRARAFFAAGKLPNGYSIREDSGSYEVINQWTNKTIKIRPLFHPDDRYRVKPGEQPVTVGFDYPGITRVNNILEVITSR